MNKYSVILADPAWQFDVWDKGTGRDRSPDQHYPTMTLEDICNLPIANLSADNCALFLWTTDPHLFNAQKVIEAWGFTYRTVAWVWVKLNKRGSGLHMGLGYYTRANPEYCLLAVKGQMPVENKGIESVILAPRGEHSRKPDEQYRRIEQLYPAGKRLELFARVAWPGWDIWGNNLEQSIRMDRYAHAA